jgi:hypothetical protein
VIALVRPSWAPAAFSAARGGVADQGDARPDGQDLLTALEAFLGGTAVARYAGTAEFDRFRALINRTPELRVYWRQTWLRHAAALAGGRPLGWDL